MKTTVAKAVPVSNLMIPFLINLQTINCPVIYGRAKLQRGLRILAQIPEQLYWENGVIQPGVFIGNFDSWNADLTD